MSDKFKYSIITSTTNIFSFNDAEKFQQRLEEIGEIRKEDWKSYVKGYINMHLIFSFIVFNMTEALSFSKEDLDMEYLNKSSEEGLELLKRMLNDDNLYEQIKKEADEEIVKISNNYENWKRTNNLLKPFS